MLYIAPSPALCDSRMLLKEDLVLPMRSADSMPMNSGCSPVFPEIGSRARARVTKTTFTQVSLQLFEVEGRRTEIEYRAFFRPTDLGQEHLCDRFRKNDVVDCVVVSYGDAGIFVALSD